MVLFAEHPSVLSDDAMKLGALANGMLELTVEHEGFQPLQEFQAVGDDFRGADNVRK
jgi:hypothetical protein